MVFGDPVGLTDLEPPVDTSSVDEEKAGSKYTQEDTVKLS
jgi:hypothetical protein